MKIYEIIVDVAMLLGKADIVDTLQNFDQSQQSDLLQNGAVYELYNLTKYAVREICTHHVPMLQQTEIDIQDKTYSINNLTNFIALSWIKQNGNKVAYKVVNRKIKVKQNGKYQIEYLSYPNIQSLNEDIDYLSQCDPSMIVNAICAYYCLTKGLFAEFDGFYAKYQDMAEKIEITKSFMLPLRSWQ